MSAPSRPTAAVDARLLSMEEFALAIGKSVRSVSRYVRQGRLLTVTVADMGRPVLRIPEAELERFGHRHDGQPPLMADTDSGELADIGHPVWRMADTMADVRQPDPAGFIAASDLLPRYEAAAVRLGWLEGQLDMTRRMLTDGGQREGELREQLEAERRERQRIEHELAIMADVRQRAEEAERRTQETATQLAAAEQKLEALQTQTQRSWWRKLFT